MTRTWTPDSVNWLTGSRRIRVKRACNGCGRTIGDVTDDEMQRCFDGRPLPDVRPECGCVPPTPPDKCTATANPRKGLTLRCDRTAEHEHLRESTGEHWHYDLHQDAHWSQVHLDGETCTQVEFRTVGGHR